VQAAMIERIFRYVEMIGVIALLRTVIMPRYDTIGQLMTFVLAVMASSYLVTPLLRSAAGRAQESLIESRGALRAGTEGPPSPFRRVTLTAALPLLAATAASYFGALWLSELLSAMIAQG